MKGPEGRDDEYWDPEGELLREARDLGEGCGHMDERDKGQIGRDIQAAERHLRGGDETGYDKENPYGR